MEQLHARYLPARAARATRVLHKNGPPRASRRRRERYPCALRSGARDIARAAVTSPARSDMLDWIAVLCALAAWDLIARVVRPFARVLSAFSTHAPTVCVVPPPVWIGVHFVVLTREPVRGALSGAA
jgi:hypothetical protein